MAKRLAQYDVFDLPLKDIYNDSDFNCRGQFTLESVADLGLQTTLPFSVSRTRPLVLTASR